MPDKAKVLIGIPGFNGIQPEAQRNFMGMVFRCGRDMPQYDFAVEVVTKKEQFRARNSLVDRAIGGGFEWLLMLDDDMIVPSDLLQKLLAHKKDVVGALYYQRGGAYHPVVMRRVENEETGDWNIHFYNMHDPIIRKPGLYEVDVIGGGCMLFHMDVFSKITPPYFWWESRLGTDVAICTRLQEAGYTIYIDTAIELAHLGDKPMISSRTLPSSIREAGIYQELLWADAKEYLCMPDEELLSKMEQAAGEKTRRDHWDLADRTRWEGIRHYYTAYGEWHILNLLFYVYHKPDRFLEWVLLHAPHALPTGATVLDLGPGIGDKAFPMAHKHEYRVYCADLAQTETLDFLEWRAKKHGLLPQEHRHRALIPWRFHEAVPENDLPEQVDCVLMISMLEHLSDPFGTLEWVQRQLNPGGVLVCDYYCNTQENEPQHLLRYDPTTFGLWMRNHGWEESVELSWVFHKKE